MDLGVMGGVLCVRCTRIPVLTVARFLSAKLSEEEILRTFPDLYPEDIQEIKVLAYRKLVQFLEDAIPSPRLEVVKKSKKGPRN